MASQRLKILYRRKTIIAHEKAEGWGARAFDGKLPSSQIHHAPTSDHAILAVQEELDQEAAKEAARRGEDGFPTADLVKDAFRRIRPSEGQFAMLKAHLNAPDYVLTATELAAAAGKDSYEYTNAQYGRLARSLAEEMEFTPSQTYSATGLPIWTFAIATGVSDNVSIGLSEEHVEWRWKLRPQLVEALTSLGIS